MTHTNPTSGLFTDLYQLTMAQAYWRSRKTADATFSLFFRGYPPDRGYFVFAGLPGVVDHLEGFGFSDEDIEFLGTLGQFDAEFLAYLREFRFTGRLRAMTEGAIFFAGEPVIEVTAPVIEGQLLETALLNLVSAPVLLATKASRLVHAARGRTVVDFAARRTHGVDISVKLARACYMVGFAGTSNVLAGKLHGIPTSGTMAHSFVTTFESELDAFKAYAQTFPGSTTLLVDTYDTLEGTRNAIRVAHEMERQGHALRAIRLDSGDLSDLSPKCRAMLDEAGLHGVQIFASGGLDEFEVDRLLRNGAPIDGFGIGTRLGVSADAPTTDCVYKLVEYNGRPVLKLSPGKQTLPGRKQVFRSRDGAGGYRRDIITLDGEPSPEKLAEPLLSDVIADGRRLGPDPSLEQLRTQFAREFASLPDLYKSLRSPERYDVIHSKLLNQLGSSVARQAGKS
jgi:nicotinate phosphoribosyltransferase